VARAAIISGGILALLMVIENGDDGGRGRFLIAFYSLKFFFVGAGIA
jgi:hypothetical protein